MRRAVVQWFLTGGINWDSWWSTRTPSNPVLTVVNETRIDGTFTINGTGQDGHKVYISTNNIDFIYKCDAVGNAFSAIGLSAGTRYYFYIVAYKGTHESPASNTANDWTAIKMVLTATGTGAGVSTVRFWFNATNVIVTLDGNGKWYSDAAGTLNESTSYTFVAGALRTRYLKVTAGTSNMIIFAKNNWLRWGDDTADGWTSGTNAPSIACTLTGITLTQLRMTGTSVVTGALPTGLTYLWLYGASIAWTYNGALPTVLTSLYLNGNSIAWTYEGALPTGLTFVLLQGTSIAWTYNGALPTGLTYLWLYGASIAWTYNGALPTGLTYLYLLGASIAWTGLDIGNNGNITTFSLSNYRIAKMSSADMVTLLTQMTNRTGTLPATVVINDYADYASPPVEVTDAVAALKVAKSITTVNLGA